MWLQVNVNLETLGSTQADLEGHEDMMCDSRFGSTHIESRIAQAFSYPLVIGLSRAGNGTAFCSELRSTGTDLGHQRVLVLRDPTAKFSTRLEDRNYHSMLENRCANDFILDTLLICICVESSDILYFRAAGGSG